MTAPFKFFTPIKVRFNETDLQGHVNFVHCLTCFDVGATEYMAAIGCDYDTMLAEGVDLLSPSPPSAEPGPNGGAP